MVKRFVSPNFLEVVSNFDGLKGAKKCIPVCFDSYIGRFLFYGLTSLPLWRCFDLIPEHMGWVSSERSLRFKQNRNRGDLLWDGLL